MGKAVHALAHEVGIATTDIARVGLGSPGPLDIPQGRIVRAGNLPGWDDLPRRDRVSDHCGLPVTVANDANAAAFGEFWIGTGKIHDSMVLLTLGTGVGGGVIIDNELVVGRNSFGGECGHMIIDPSPEARLCAWGGGRGHLEAYASASGVTARAREELQAGAKSILASQIDKITAKRIFEAAEQGDPWSLKFIEQTGDYLAIGITSMVHMVDPGLVVLGGAMNFGGSNSPTGQRFLESVRRGFEARTFQYVQAGTHIEFASLGADAGYIGAAGIARCDYHKAL
jgi:glucokinase